jgi:hypothetical protein
MISIGVNLGGPEAVRIESLLRAAMKAVKAARGNSYESHAHPAVNVVFYVPGSLIDYADLKQMEPARFSRKQKLLLVAVPVPKEEVERGGSVDFLIDALHEANRIAAETFAKKGTELFDFENAEVIVEQVRQSLVDQGF